MLYSMTGYGEATRENDQIRVGFRIKSVNYRGLDVHLKLPFDFMYLESTLRKKIKDALFRGRIDIFCEIEVRDPDCLPPTPLNRARLHQLLGMAAQMSDEFGIGGELDINTLVRFSDLTLTNRVGFTLPNELETEIAACFSSALDSLTHNRQREGQSLIGFFQEVLETIRSEVSALAMVASSRRDELLEAIRKRVTALLNDIELDENRLNQELVFLADRLDITEEITRLKTHAEGLSILIHSEKRPLGREIEFVIQEMFREITTIGNKAKHQAIAEKVVLLKTACEKMREQVLNIE